MTYAGDSSIDARVRDVNAAFGRRRTRLFLTFALVEGPILVLLAVLVFAFEIVDPEIGVWFVVAAAMLGGFLLMMFLVRSMKAQAQAIAQAKGENPLF